MTLKGNTKLTRQLEMSFRISRLADKDIMRIWYEGADKFGVTQAKKYNFELSNLFELLANHPKMGRQREEIGNGLRTHPFRSHIVIYSLDDLGVLIVRVRHAHEDWMSDPV
jgi:toxin ParE1/3/4